MDYIILFLLGSAIGSFLNVLIYRLEESEKRKTQSEKEDSNYQGSISIVLGRSYCPNCKHQIRWYDNIPILSFLILRAKCRDCHEKISIQYPLIEIATGMLFLLIFNFQFSIFNKFSIINFQTIQITDWIVLMYLLATFSGLFAILVYDFKHYIIPNKIIYPLIALVLGFGILNLFGNWNLKIENFNSWQEIILSLLIPLFFLFLIVISKGKWMGMGDVKLALFMALFLGWPSVLVAVFSAFWLGTLVGLPLVISGKKKMQSQIPFGPFLIIGTFIAFFWSSQIIQWYLSISY